MNNAEETKEVLQGLRDRSVLNNTPIWASNMGRNVIWATRDAFSVPIQWKDTVMVFASGASLLRYKGRMKDLNGKVSVIATPTNYAWLQSEGVDVDMIVVMDSHPIMGKMIEDYRGLVVAATTVDVSVSAHKAHFYKLYVNGETTWNMVQDMMFPYISGGYPAEYGCVTNVAFALACDLSRKRVVLAGADYSYWHSYSRIAEEMTKVDDPQILWRGVGTDPAMVLYKDALLKIWANVALSIPVFSMSEGIIDEIPTVTLDDVLNENWPELLTKDEVVKKVSKHIDEFSHYAEVLGEAR